jgi:hypothetical protein
MLMKPPSDFSARYYRPTQSAKKTGFCCKMMCIEYIKLSEVIAVSFS